MQGTRQKQTKKQLLKDLPYQGGLSLPEPEFGVFYKKLVVCDIHQPPGQIRQISLDTQMSHLVTKH